MTKSEKDTYEILKEQLVGGTSSSEGQIARMQIADIESRPDDNLAQIKSVLEKRVCFSNKVFSSFPIMMFIDFIHLHKHLFPEFAMMITSFLYYCTSAFYL